jgi:hypothetical protein
VQWFKSCRLKILILNFNRLPCSYYSFFAKVVFLKVFHPPNIYQNAKFHGPALTSASFASTSEVWTSAILKWLQIRYSKLWRRGYLQWHDLPTEFHKNLPVDLKDDSGDRHISLHFSFRKESRLIICLYTYIILISQVSRVAQSVIVSGYGLDDRPIDVRSPAGAKGFFL